MTIPFETLYGMELLATVHWLVNNEPALKDDPAAIMHEVHSWNAHKQAFIPHHIQTTYSRLCEAGWLAPAPRRCSRSVMTIDCRTENVF